MGEETNELAGCFDSLSCNNQVHEEDVNESGRKFEGKLIAEILGTFAVD